MASLTAASCWLLVTGGTTVTGGGSVTGGTTVGGGGTVTGAVVVLGACVVGAGVVDACTGEFFTCNSQGPEIMSPALPMSPMYIILADPPLPSI